MMQGGGGHGQLGRRQQLSRTWREKTTFANHEHIPIVEILVRRIWADLVQNQLERSLVNMCSGNNNSSTEFEVG
jgi:hypothetical protein